MNSINKEQDLLKSISCQIKGKNYFDDNEYVCESYYIPSTQRTELTSYSFESIVELRKKLTEMWSDDERMLSFIPVVLAAVFKNRPETENLSVPLIEHKDGSNGGILPVYTYTL